MRCNRRFAQRAADEPNVADSLGGIVARPATGSVNAMAEICDTADLMLSFKHLQAACMLLMNVQAALGEREMP